MRSWKASGSRRRRPWTRRERSAVESRSVTAAMPLKELNIDSGHGKSPKLENSRLPAPIAPTFCCESCKGSAPLVLETVFDIPRGNDKNLHVPRVELWPRLSRHGCTSFFSSRNRFVVRGGDQVGQQIEPAQYHRCHSTYSTGPYDKKSRDDYNYV